MFKNTKKIVFLISTLFLKSILINHSIELNNKWALYSSTPYDYPFSSIDISDGQPYRYFIWDSETDVEERFEELEIY